MRSLRTAASKKAQPITAHKAPITKRKAPTRDQKPNFSANSIITEDLPFERRPLFTLIEGSCRFRQSPTCLRICPRPGATGKCNTSATSPPVVSDPLPTLLACTFSWPTDTTSSFTVFGNRTNSPVRRFGVVYTSSLSSRPRKTATRPADISPTRRASSNCWEARRRFTTLTDSFVLHMRTRPQRS